MIDEEIEKIEDTLLAAEKTFESTFKGEGNGGNVYREAYRCIQELEAENTELKARLEKAVELPCKVGDTVYGIGITDCDDAHTTDEKQKRKIFNDCMDMSGHCEKCKHGHLAVTEFVCAHIQIGENGISNSNILIVGKKNENYIAENVFPTREAAEAKLKELQGGQSNADNRS